MSDNERLGMRRPLSGFSYVTISHHGQIATGAGWIAMALVFIGMALGASVSMVRINDTAVIIYGPDGVKVCEITTLKCQRIETAIRP